MIQEYKFTGYSPSGNPFKWLHDAIRNITFEDSISTQIWDKQPKINDNIRYEKSGTYNEVIEKVWINNELVFIRSKKNDEKRERYSKEIHDNLKRKKGFIK
jgi:hypothetical protein